MPGFLYSYPCHFIFYNFMKSTSNMEKSILLRKRLIVLIIYIFTTPPLWVGLGIDDEKLI